MAASAGSAPGAPVLSAPGNLWRFSYSPVLSAVYSDPDGDPGTVTFTVQDRTGATVRTVTSGQVSSGATASVNLASNALAVGWYSWSAKASDGTSTGASSGSRKFEVSPASAATPGLGVKPFYSFEEFALADRAQLQVNVASGNVLLRSKDLAIRGTAGHDLVLERVYNNNASIQQDREMGPQLVAGPGPARRALPRPRQRRQRPDLRG